MTADKPIALTRACTAIMIPSGERIELAAGDRVWLTQALGGAYTVMTERGYTVRIEGRDADALGMTQREARAPGDDASGSAPVEDLVWSRLRSCFDPEIPVNIVDLGLIYRCEVSRRPDGGHKVSVRFTLTAQGCGMGRFLKEDIEKKLLTLPGVREVDVELVWDPPWNQSMISHSAKQQLGME